MSHASTPLVRTVEDAAGRTLYRISRDGGTTWARVSAAAVSRLTAFGHAAWYVEPAAAETPAEPAYADGFTGRTVTPHASAQADGCTLCGLAAEHPVHRVTSTTPAAPVEDEAPAIGTRVALHAASDLWMRGVRYATVYAPAYFRAGAMRIGVRADNGQCFAALLRDVLPVEPTTPAPVSDPEREALDAGTLTAALLAQAGLIGLSAHVAHHAFALAVPRAARVLGLDARRILAVTDHGRLLYGPNGLTIAEECEASALALLDEDDDAPAGTYVLTIRPERSHGSATAVEGLTAPAVREYLHGVPAFRGEHVADALLNGADQDGTAYADVAAEGFVGTLTLTRTTDPDQFASMRAAFSGGALASLAAEAVAAQRERDAVRPTEALGDAVRAGSPEEGGKSVSGAPEAVSGPDAAEASSPTRAQNQPLPPLAPRYCVRTTSTAGHYAAPRRGTVDTLWTAPMTEDAARSYLVGLGALDPYALAVLRTADMREGAPVTCTDESAGLVLWAVTR